MFRNLVMDLVRKATFLLLHPIQEELVSYFGLEFLPICYDLKCFTRTCKQINQIILHEEGATYRTDRKQYRAPCRCTQHSPLCYRDRDTCDSTCAILETFLD